MERELITLEFPKATSDLTGNKLGRSVFNSQIKDKIGNEKDKVLVEIPKSINDVGTSFIQGIYAFLSETYGSNEALSIMEIYSKNEEANNKIKKVISVYGI